MQARMPASDLAALSCRALRRCRCTGAAGRREAGPCALCDQDVRAAANRRLPGCGSASTATPRTAPRRALQLLAAVPSAARRACFVSFPFPAEHPTHAGFPGERRQRQPGRPRLRARALRLGQQPRQQLWLRCGSAAAWLVENRCVCDPVPRRGLRPRVPHPTPPSGPPPPCCAGPQRCAPAWAASGRCPGTATRAATRGTCTGTRSASRTSWRVLTHLAYTVQPGPGVPAGTASLCFTHELARLCSSRALRTCAAHLRAQAGTAARRTPPPRHPEWLPPCRPACRATTSGWATPTTSAASVRGPLVVVTV